MFINAQEYRVRVFCETMGIDFLPLTAMSNELFEKWVEWSRIRIVRHNGKDVS